MIEIVWKGSQDEAIQSNNVLPLDVDFPAISIPPRQSLISLRDYQEEAFLETKKALEKYQSALVVLATGLGKSVLIAKFVEDYPDRVLVITNLEEILQNLISEINAFAAEVCGVERADEHAATERVVCGLIQSIGGRYARVFRPDDFGLIIVDEAHNSPDAYRKVFEFFPNAKIIGFTATDFRSDRKALPYDTVSYRMGIREGIERGYLVPIHGEKIFIESIDLRRVKVSLDGDFNEEALDSEIVKGASAIADIIYENYFLDKGVLFFPGCGSARLTCDFLNKKQPGIAAYVDGKIRGPERRRLIDSVRKGDGQWLCNVGIATEGFNWPEASVIGIAVPTTSWTAYVQRVGRGTRPLAGILNGLSSVESRAMAIAKSSKPYMKVLDFVGVSANLNLVSYENFLSTEPGQQNVDLGCQASADAHDEIKEHAAEEKQLLQPVLDVKSFKTFVAQVESKTISEIEEFDVFGDSGGRLEKRKKGVEPDKNSEPSEKQVKLLAKYGIDTFGMSKTVATKCTQFIASKGWRLTNFEKGILKKISIGGI